MTRTVIPYDAGQRQRSLPLFTNGLATITTDQLHAYEEGMEAVGQLMLMDYGNPLYMARGMEIAKRILEDVTQIAPDGHRHFRSRLYGGTSMSTEDPWQWSGYHSYNVLHTAYMVARYNGNPSLKKMIIEIADGLLAHRDEDGKINTDVHFTTGEVRDNPGMVSTWQVLLAAYDFSGDKKYLDPIERPLGRAVKFKPEEISDRYNEIITELAVREYINTEGSIWIDRISANSNDLQADRLGGIALARIRHIYQQNYLSWEINKPAGFESLAVFTEEGSPSKIKAVVYNMNPDKVSANISLWGIKPGQWKIQYRTESISDRDASAVTTVQKIYLERGSVVKLEFDPGKYSYISLELLEADPNGYDKRADLAISPSNIRIEENRVRVRVYSQGATGSPETTIVLRDASGEKISAAKVPPMDAPLDLIPRWVDIVLEVPAGSNLDKGSLEVDPANQIKQITRLNTLYEW